MCAATFIMMSDHSVYSVYVKITSYAAVTQPGHLSIRVWSVIAFFRERQSRQESGMGPGQRIATGFRNELQFMAPDCRR